MTIGLKTMKMFVIITDILTIPPTCSSSVKDTSARGGKGSSCNMGRNSLSCKSIGI